MLRFSPLELLRRTDKISLGGGRMVIWAPEFPLWAERPGFWDHAAFLEHKVEPLFTVTLLDSALREIPLTLQSRSWTPAALTQVYHSSSEGHEPRSLPAAPWSTEAHLRVEEEKCLHPRDVLISTLTIANLRESRQPLTLVLWTAQARGPEKDGPWIENVHIMNGCVQFTRRARGGGVVADSNISFVLGADLEAASFSLNHSEWSTGRINHPRWELTPFYESITPQGLPGHLRLAGGPYENADNTLLYMALAYPLQIEAGESASITFGCALAPEPEEAEGNFNEALRPLSGYKSLDARIAALGTRRMPRITYHVRRARLPDWPVYFYGAPQFRCSDPYFERYFYYRLFGLKLNMVNTGGRFNLPWPVIFEGINTGWFRHQISYSSHALMREARWLARVAPGLMKYAAYYKAEHDRENSGLYDVRNQAETGQEYMSRYLFVDPEGDRWGPLRLKGVDATVYAYNLNRALAWIAGKLSGDSAPYEREAEAISAALLEKMWDPERRFFFDVHPQTGERSAAMAAIGFYPFLTDIPGPEHLVALDYLFDPEAFGTPYPLPATAVSDPAFSAFGEWKDRRHVCPWNGRAWLMTTSHVCQALAHTARRFPEMPELRQKPANLIKRYIRALFIDGDVERPCSFEYYNPLTGQQPFFRGTDDYMHSWVLDLILQFVVGLQPSPDSSVLTIDPLPFGLEHFKVDNVRVRGRVVGVRWRAGKGLEVRMAGKLVAQRADLGPLDLDLQQ